MARFTTICALLLFFFAFCLPQHGVFAFGAGNIPSFAFVEGKAFRHGDIEDALSDLVKRSGGGFALVNLITKGSKFSSLDVKRVYFGNWLRDYSQAVDIAGLKKLQLQSIITLCMVLGFLAHGYVTAEFEVTAERLGVYLPVEHIDNPKGYGEGEDARKYHPKLRGPVDPRELDIDPRSGMKNYIANEQGGWDTSKAHVRRVLQECIRYGRMYRSNSRKEDEYEAFRLLGTALHTLEDFTAHSNWCELVLASMGRSQVFVHVGDNVRIQAPNGKWVAPLVTGTFGSSDFIHSLLGEATDHMSEASVTDLSKEFDRARSRSQGTRGQPGFDSVSTLRSLLTSVPGGAGNSMARDMDSIERIRAGPTQGGKRPEDMDPRELHSTIWQVLTFRDSVMKSISETLEKIPGLGSLVDKITDSISVFVLTTIEPFVKPLLKTATQGLTAASAEVLNSGDQYQVFDDPRASDPTHSFLSKDHFNLILNEPAGEIAKVVVVHAVSLITKAWDNDSANVNDITEDILSCLFHPDFHDSRSKVQREMLQCMHSWVDGLGGNSHSILSRLTKQQVRMHKNVRAAGENGPAASEGTFAAAEAHGVQQSLLNYAQNVPGVGLATSLLTRDDGSRKEMQYAAASADGSSSYYARETQYNSGYGTEGTGTHTSYPSQPFVGETNYSSPHYGSDGTSLYSSTTTFQAQSSRPTQSSYGGLSEPPAQSGYAPAYLSPDRAPGFPSFPAEELTRYGGHPNNASRYERRHEDHEARHEDHQRRHEARHEAHEARHETRRQHHETGHGDHYSGKEGSTYGYGNAPGGFPEIPSGTEYGHGHGSAPGFPGADTGYGQHGSPGYPGVETGYGQQSAPGFPDTGPYGDPSRRPPFLGSQPPADDSYQYGWRG